MGVSRKIIFVTVVFLASCAFAQNSDFSWDWRNQEVIGREDASVGNTSQLNEPERSSLIDAIVLRLQKPMGDAGYDDQRIREIASTTRIRFIPAGKGEPLVFTTSLGLEGGCDGLGNCPLWVFRRTDDGFLSLLNTIAASFTTQPSDSGFEVVFMHHVSPQESGLAVYRLDGNELAEAGCYTARWPKPNGDPTQLSDPKVEACKTPPLVQSARPEPEGEKAEAPASSEPAQAQPSAEPPSAQPGQESAQPKEPEAPAAEAPKGEQAQPQAPPDQAQPDAKQEAPQPEPTSPQAPAPQPAPDAQQNAPQTEPAQPPQNPPDANAPAPDDKQPQTAPNQEQPAPDAPKQSPPDQGSQPATPQPEQPASPQPEAPPSQASPN